MIDDILLPETVEICQIKERIKIFSSSFQIHILTPEMWSHCCILPLGRLWQVSDFACACTEHCTHIGVQRHDVGNTAVRQFVSLCDEHACIRTSKCRVRRLGGTLCTVTASRRRNRCVGSNTSGSTSSAAAAPPSLGRLGPNPGHTSWEGTKICFLIVHTFMMIRCLERDKKTRTQNKEML